MGYDITKEDLVMAHSLHQRLVDNLAESEEEATALTRRFLSYLPSSTYEAPPVTDCSDDPTDAKIAVHDDPTDSTSTFDVRKVIRLLATAIRFSRSGRSGNGSVTGFVRFNGYPMGVIAPDSRHENGGADCRRLRQTDSPPDLCDLFHLPVLNLSIIRVCRWPRTRDARHYPQRGEWMVAFSQVNVPIFSVDAQEFGVAGNNYVPQLACV